MKVLFSESDIKSFNEKIAQDIRNHYKSEDGSNLVVLSILKGALFFAVDLLRELDYPKCSLEFIRLSSYHGGTESSGLVQIHGEIKENLTNKDILVLDEIIDTGRTLKFLNDYLQKKFSPKSVKFACLLDKKECRKIEFNADFIGKEIPNHFVVGYGLDLNEHYRTLSTINIYESE